MDLAFQCQGTQEKRFADLWTDTIGKDLPELKWRGKMNPLICEPGELLEIGEQRRCSSSAGVSFEKAGYGN